MEVGDDAAFVVDPCARGSFLAGCVSADPPFFETVLWWVGGWVGGLSRGLCDTAPCPLRPLPARRCVVSLAHMCLDVCGAAVQGVVERRIFFFAENRWALLTLCAVARWLGYRPLDRLTAASVPSRPIIGADRERAAQQCLDR